MTQAKPLDLSNLLRHAFTSGFMSMGGKAESVKDWWPEYNPEECPAFERIADALAARSTVPEAGKAVVWLPDPIGVNEIWQTVYDSLDLSEDLRTECADEISRAIAKTFSSPASVPAPSGAIKIDDVDRDMIARGDRIGADLQRALLKFYDDHAIPSSEAEPKAKRVQHRVRPHKKAEWGPWIDGYVPKDYLGWFEQREVAPQAVPAEDVAKQPLSRMSADDGRPMWEQISDLIKFHMNERPPIRLRDELVTILAWARYGEARAIASEAAAPLPEDTHHGR